MSRTKTVDVKVFPARVILTTGRKAFLRERAKFDVDPLVLEDASGCSSEFGATYIVGVFDGRLSTLVHELAHTTFKILHDCNVPATREASEAFCYLQEWLFEELRSTVK